MRKRPMCLICLVLIGVILLMRNAGLPIWRAPQVSEELKELLEQGADVFITGQIINYEKKSNSAGYILSSCILKYQQQEIPCEQFYIITEQQDLNIGSWIRVFGTLKKAEAPRNPGQYDSRNYYALRRVTGYIIAEQIEICSEGKAGIREAARRFRDVMEDSCDMLLPEREAGVLKAMVWGDKTGLAKELESGYRQGGMLHALTVSGMHLSLLGMLCCRLLLCLRIRPIPAALCSVILMTLYTVITGSGAAAVRALIMFSVLMTGRCIGRTYDGLSALAFAVILMLLYQPEYLFYSGFWLSAAAVLGAVFTEPILFGNQRTTGKGKIKANGIRNCLRFHLSVTITMLPVTVWCFYEIPVLSVAANLLIVPTLAFVMLPGAAGCVLGGVSPGVGRMLMLPVHFLLVFYERIVDTLRRIPGSVWICGQPAAWQVFFYYGILILVLAARWYFGEKRRSGLLVGAGLLAACMLLFWRNVPEFQVTVLDVGQGDSIVVRGGRYSILVDGGSSDVKSVGTYRILPYLKQQGIGRLDGIIVTHPDSDHINGILELLELMGGRDTALKADRLFLPIWMKGAETEQVLLIAAERAGVPVSYLQKGDMLQLGLMQAEILHPGSQAEQGDYQGDVNAGSIVMRVTHGNYSVLLTGDLEGSGEEAVLPALSCCDLLKVAHHGSKNSTSDSFLEGVRPGISIFSCAYPSRYGHPHAELLERIRKSGSRIYGTPVCGAVTVWRKGQKTYLRGFLSSDEFEKEGPKVT